MFSYLYSKKRYYSIIYPNKLKNKEEFLIKDSITSKERKDIGGSTIN
jgi:hypothetical protein